MTNIPKAQNISRSAISRIAQSFVGKHNIVQFDHINKAVKLLGGNIEHRDFLTGHHDDATLSIAKSRAFTIFIPVHGDLYSSLWNVCHELGHYILHYLPTDFAAKDEPMLAYRIDDPLADKEADMFATFLCSYLNTNQHVKGKKNNDTSMHSDIMLQQTQTDITLGQPFEKISEEVPRNVDSSCTQIDT